MGKILSSDCCWCLVWAAGGRPAGGRDLSSGPIAVLFGGCTVTLALSKPPVARANTARLCVWTGPPSS